MRNLTLFLAANLTMTSGLCAQTNNSGLVFNQSFAKQVASTSNGAFPYDSAGILAYTQIPPDSVDIQKGVEAFSQLEELGANYAMGIVDGQKLYFDKNGWVVSYLPKGSIPALLVRSYDANILASTNLSVPIYDVLEKMISSSQSFPISYSYLENPTVDSLLVFWSSQQGNVSFQIPNTYNVINQSISLTYSHPRYGSVSDLVSVSLSLDGASLIHVSFYTNQITSAVITKNINAALGQAHTLSLSLSNHVSSRYAYVILYSH